MLVIGLCAGSLAQAQAPGGSGDYPSKPVRIIVPIAAGGGTDVMSRVVAQTLSERLGKQFIVDNRPGAAGTIGTLAAARSPNDGYTLLISAVGTYASSMSFDPKLNYGNMRTDFAPISMLGTSPLVLVVSPSLGVRSARDLIALIKTKPGALNFGSSGTGGLSHLTSELFRQMADVNVTHVPYKGSAQILPAVLSGEIAFSMDTAPAYLPFIKDGRLLALAVTGLKRSSFLADVPTVNEAALPGYESVASYGIFAPAGTSREIVAYLNREINLVLALPQVRDRLVPLGIEAAGSTPEVLSTFTEGEIAKWSRVIKTAGIKAN